MSITYTPATVKQDRAYRRRRIDQYVVTLPTNAGALLALATDLNNNHPGVPDHRVKITVDDNNMLLVVSVPTDWREEDAATCPVDAVDEDAS